MKANSRIAKEINAISAALPQGVTLIAVSKYHPAEAVMEAYEAGQRDFGESKAQDLVKKHEMLPQDIKWHFIGHLQSNKIKYIAPFIHLIHSIDSYRLLQEVDRHAEKNGRTINCLLQIHIAEEESKFGFTPEELEEMIEEKGEEPFKLTYADDGTLYIAVGYGKQPTSGYSIKVTELYETENAIYIHTNLIGPAKDEKILERATYPYIVIKTEFIDKNVVFE